MVKAIRSMAQEAANGNKTGFACDLCTGTFTTPQGLGRHRLGAHGIAGQSSSAKARSRGLRRRQKNKPPPVVACGLCDHVAVSPQGLGIHKLHSHGLAGERSRKVEPAVVPTSKEPESPSLPTLGQRVQVTLLAMDPESGQVTVGLDGRWRATLV